MRDDVVRKPKVLSGIAATGTLHIGNYIGALSVWAQERDAYDNYFMIADLHALTIPENVKADELPARIREIVALHVACGLDPDRSAIFRQSDVSAHATLTRADDTALERILADGAKRAASVANQTLDEAMRLTGLR